MRSSRSHGSLNVNDPDYRGFRVRKDWPSDDLKNCFASDQLAPPLGEAQVARIPFGSVLNPSGQRARRPPRRLQSEALRVRRLLELEISIVSSTKFLDGWSMSQNTIAPAVSAWTATGC